MSSPSLLPYITSYWVFGHSSQKSNWCTIVKHGLQIKNSYIWACALFWVARGALLLSQSALDANWSSTQHSHPVDTTLSLLNEPPPCPKHPQYIHYLSSDSLVTLVIRSTVTPSECYVQLQLSYQSCCVTILMSFFTWSRHLDTVPSHIISKAGVQCNMVFYERWHSHKILL